MNHRHDDIDRFQQQIRLTNTPVDDDGLLDRWLRTAGRLTLATIDREGHPFPEQIKDLRREVERYD